MLERWGLRWSGWWRSLTPPAQDAVIALLTFAGCALLTFVDTGTFIGADPNPVWVRLVLVAGCCSLQLLRRRRPVLGLLIGVLLVGIDALLGLTLPIVLAFTDLIYAATLYSSTRSGRLVVRGTVVATVAIGVVTAFVSADLRITVLVLLIVAAVAISPMQAALAVRHHRDRAAWERERAVADRALDRLNQAAAIDAERTRMARELHDVISGHLSAIALQTEAMLRTESTGGLTAERRSEILGAIRQQSLQGLSSMRTMIDMLRAKAATEVGGDPDDQPPADLQQLPVTLTGSIPQLRALVDGAGSVLTVQAEPDPLPALPSAVDLAAYRIVVEALTNAVKHAPGSAVALRIRLLPEAAEIEVSNGPTSPGDADRTPLGGSGTGLTNMLQRVTALGGRFEAGPIASPAGGWSVRARIPLTVAAVSGS